jgi:hypothetical protein
MQPMFAAVIHPDCQAWLLLLVACLPIPTGPLSPLLFTAIHSQGPSLLSFAVFSLSIIDTHNRLLQQSLHLTTIRQFIPFGSLKGCIHSRALHQAVS